METPASPLSAGHGQHIVQPGRAAWGESLYSDPARPITARDVKKRLHRRRGLGLLICLAVWLGAVAVVAFVPPRYKATTILLVDTARLGQTAARYSSADDVVSVFGLPTLANQAAILRSVPAIAETTAARVLAEVAPEDMDRLPSTDAQKLSEWLRESAVKILADGGQKEADLIRIEATAGGGELAALISSTYGDSYVRMIRDAVGRQRQSALDSQRARVAAAVDELNGLDQQLRQFWLDNGTASLEQDAASAATRISDLRTLLDDARINFSTHRATLESLESELSDLDLDRLADRVASSVEAEIATTNDQLAITELNLEQFYSKNEDLRSNPQQSPQVMQLLNDASVMKARLDDLADRFVNEVMATGGIDLTGNADGRAYVLSLRRRIAEERVAKHGAEARISAINARLAAFESSRTRYSEQAVPLVQIERGRDQADARLKAEIDRLGVLQVAEPADYVKRMQAAEIPDKPSFPNALLVLAGGFVLGILLGGGAAFGASSMDTRIYEASDLAPLGIPVRGTLPDLTKTVRKLFGKEKEVHAGNRIVSSNLVVLHDPHSPEAAMLRKYALGLAARTPRGGSILLTSADTGAGKTTIVANLGAALGLAGYRTLVIDADIFRNGQMKALGLTARSCLNLETGAFSSGGGIEQFGGALQLLFGVVLGSRKPSDSEAIAVQTAARLAQFYGEHFDYVLIDSPPTTASSIAAGIGPYANTRVLVVGAGHTSLELVELAVSELHSHGASPTEMAINRMDMDGPTAFRSAYQQAQAYYGSASQG
jgi:polysaccharide biosynthesis transport protein